MRLPLLTVAATATLALGVTLADAAPLLPLVADGGTPTVTLVAQGCGLGYSRGAYGRCRPTVFGFGVPGARRYGYGYGGYYGYGRPYGYGYGRPCGYGYRALERRPRRFGPAPRLDGGRAF